jgi:hypothetical protein
MRHLTFPAIVIAGLVLAPQATTQNATGTIDVRGTVAGRCSVDGQSAGALSGVIDLQEIAAPDGTLRPDLQGPTVPGEQVSFGVTCNTGAPKVEIAATRMQTGAGAPPAGYTNVVDFTATADITTTGGATAVHYTTAASPPGPSTAILTNPLANLANNVVVRVHSFTTAQSVILTAGTYNATITITISPS